MLRRDLLRGFGSLALSIVPAQVASPSTRGRFGDERFAQAIRAAEAKSSGRLGVAVLDSETAAEFAWRGDERFPVTSTFKFLLAAAVLAAADQGRERLDRRIAIRADDLLEYAPVTGKRVGADGLTISELCEAIIVWSDNTAANLLLATVGGPLGLTKFARSLGDAQFQLDRPETALNEASPGDVRDTTTPAAMLRDLERLLLGTVLSTTSRQHLIDWMVACRTGHEKIRAGLPRNWRCGDKTGAGGYGTNNDIAIIWPPGRRPIVAAAYLTNTSAALEASNTALATVGRAIADALP